MRGHSWAPFSQGACHRIEISYQIPEFIPERVPSRLRCMMCTCIFSNEEGRQHRTWNDNISKQAFQVMNTTLVAGIPIHSLHPRILEE